MAVSTNSPKFFTINLVLLQKSKVGFKFLSNIIVVFTFKFNSY